MKSFSDKSAEKLSVHLSPHFSVVLGEERIVDGLNIGPLQLGELPLDLVASLGGEVDSNHREVCPVDLDKLQHFSNFCGRPLVGFAICVGLLDFLGGLARQEAANQALESLPLDNRGIGLGAVEFGLQEHWVSWLDVVLHGGGGSEESVKSVVHSVKGATFLILVWVRLYYRTKRI